MASAVQHPPADVQGADLKILILWLDQYIGKPDDYLLLKRAFFTTVDPTTGYSVPLNETNIDFCIRSQEAIEIDLDSVQFILRAFNTVDDCFEAFKQNSDKRIFLITSATKGKMLIPALAKHFQEQLKRNYPMYIFCSNMNMRSVGDVTPDNAWAMDFDDYLIIINHQDFLLERIVLDAADYFFNEGERLRNDRQLRNAQQYYQWSRILLIRYDKMNDRNINVEKHRKIQKILEEIEKELSKSKGEHERISEMST